MRRSFLLKISVATLAMTSLASAALKPTTAILVDKAKNELYVTEYRDGAFQTLKSYRATLGKVKGDKEDEGDLKTPEGIYTLMAKLLPPAIKPKLGVMAFHLNFPNSYDQIAGRRGNGIMLHGTNEPDRLSKDYDSEGCVVVKNEEIQEIESKIRLGLTPILVFSDLKPEYWKPGQNSELKAFFEKWIRDWESKSIDSYIEDYHSDFSAQGMDKAGWKRFKGNLNSRYNSIKIGPEDVRFYMHPKYTVITFTQNYHSTLKAGAVGHHSRGTKILYVAEEAGHPKIISETYTNLMW